MASQDDGFDGKDRRNTERRKTASSSAWAMDDDQFGNLLTAIVTAGTLAASHRGLLDAKMVPTYFFQVRNELRAAGIIHRNRMLSRRKGADGNARTERRAPDQFGEVG
jgi:hypothetical protein